MFIGWVCIIVVCFLFQFGDSGLTAGGQKRCGSQITCSVDEYCNRSYNRCSKCSDICDQTSHNYQQDTCEDQCQGKRAVFFTNLLPGRSRDVWATMMM